MVEQFVISFGFLGLFAISFLAATLIPLGSEAAVLVLVLLGYDPLGIFWVASVGNTLGAVVNYWIGWYGVTVVLSRQVESDDGKLELARTYFKKWGVPVLFFAWLPVIGDALTVAGGIFKVNPAVFTAWVFTGKAFRYYLVIAGASAVM